MTHAAARHVIFDLDGTLLDSENAYTDAANHVLARFGARMTPELKRRVMGGDSLSGARTVVEALGVPLSAEAYLAEREQRFVELVPTLSEIGGATAFVEALHSRAIPIALATSSHRWLCEAKLKGRAFARCFRAVVCGDDVRLARPKPAPDIFLLAAELLGAEPASCLVFEDSLHGVNAALAAGMRVVAVHDPAHGVLRSEFPPGVPIIEDFCGFDVDTLK